MVGDGDRADRPFGVAMHEDVAALTGREILERMVAGTLPAPPIARGLTFWLTEVGDGTATFEGEPGLHLYNPLGTVHGGWALTIIDSACGCAGQSILPAGVAYTTLETKANFVRAITKDTGRVRCAARVINGGRQVITTDALMTGPDGKVLAHGTSTLLVLGPR